MSATTILGLTGAVVIMVVLFEMLRRHRLREKYAVIWFVIAVSAIVVAVVPGVLFGLADLVGVKVPSNLLFFLASLLLLGLTLQHSHELGRLEERCRTLAEEVGLLRLDFEQSQTESQKAQQADGEPVEDGSE
ncbi:DUF2304 domain-containing protein [Nocardioides speluncae]|uniref:DUF2304 domain-containing protein n=1 Tax=Nocardioides speluncae TaxID=2670337 RepID=UPI000D693B84|nr:DUF2304 domain-containing protein [Nocardioides speluncae]